MRILINGYFYGGNCPPFVSYLKKFNNDVKLTNALGNLDEHGINEDYISEEDIVRIGTNKLENIAIYMLKKARIPLWKIIMQYKAKKLIKNVKPDIIINHKASEKADIMLKTGFQPQITYIYGSEVQGDKIFNDTLKGVFEASKYILTTTEEMKSYLLSYHPHLKNKIRVFPLGYFEMENIFNKRRNANKNKLRSKYNFNTTDTIFFDNRSLRGNHTGIYSILQAIERLSETHKNFKVIFLKGFLGADNMVGELKSLINNDEKLRECVALIDDIVTQEAITDYYLFSDAFISLLPTDQFGASILDAVFSDCSLVLSDLEVYKNHLGGGPFYIDNQNVNQLCDSMRIIIENKNKGKIEEEDYQKLLNKTNPNKTFKNIYNFLEELNSEYNETSLN